MADCGLIRLHLGTFDNLFSFWIVSGRVGFDGIYGIDVRCRPEILKPGLDYETPSFCFIYIFEFEARGIIKWLTQASSACKTTVFPSRRNACPFSMS